MERAGLVRSERRDGRRLFFEQGFRPEFAFAPRGTTGRVFNLLQQMPGCSSLEVSHALGLLPSDASYHLHKLSDAGLVRATREGRFVFWSLVDD
jgi:predicted transcriptional regulator